MKQIHRFQFQCYVYWSILSHSLMILNHDDKKYSNIIFTKEIIRYVYDTYNHTFSTYMLISSNRVF